MSEVWVVVTGDFSHGPGYQRLWVRSSEAAARLVATTEIFDPADPWPEVEHNFWDDESNYITIYKALIDGPGVP